MCSTSAGRFVDSCLSAVCCGFISASVLSCAVMLPGGVTLFQCAYVFGFRVLVALGKLDKASDEKSDEGRLAFEPCGI